MAAGSCSPEVSTALSLLGAAAGLVAAAPAFRQRRNVALAVRVVFLEAEGLALAGLVLAAAARSVAGSVLLALELALHACWLVGRPWDASAHRAALFAAFASAIASTVANSCLAAFLARDPGYLGALASAFALAASALQLLSAALLAARFAADSRQARMALSLFPRAAADMIRASEGALPGVCRRFSWAAAPRWMQADLVSSREAAPGPRGAKGAGRGRAARQGRAPRAGQAPRDLFPAQEGYGFGFLLHYGRRSSMPFTATVGGVQLNMLAGRGRLRAYWRPAEGLGALGAQGAQGARGGPGDQGAAGPAGAPGGHGAPGFPGAPPSPLDAASTPSRAEQSGPGPDYSDTNWSCTTETSATDFNLTPLAAGALLHRELFARRPARAREAASPLPAAPLLGPRGPSEPRGLLEAREPRESREPQDPSDEASGIESVPARPVPPGPPLGPPAVSSSPAPRPSTPALFVGAQTPRSRSRSSAPGPGAPGEQESRESREGGESREGREGEASELWMPGELMQGPLIALDPAGAPGPPHVVAGGAQRQDAVLLFSAEAAAPEGGGREGGSGDTNTDEGGSASGAAGVVGATDIAGGVGGVGGIDGIGAIGAAATAAAAGIAGAAGAAGDSSDGAVLEAVPEAVFEAARGASPVLAGESSTEASASGIGPADDPGHGRRASSAAEAFRASRTSRTSRASRVSRTARAGRGGEAADAGETLESAHPGGSAGLSGASGTAAAAHAGHADRVAAAVGPVDAADGGSEGADSTVALLAQASPPQARPTDPDPSSRRAPRGAAMAPTAWPTGPPRGVRPLPDPPELPTPLSAKERLSLIRYWTLRACKRADARFLLEVHRSNVLQDVVDILLRSPARNHPYPLHVRFINEAAVDLSGLKPELMNLLGQALFGTHEGDDARARAEAVGDLDETSVPPSVASTTRTPGDSVMTDPPWAPPSSEDGQALEARATAVQMSALRRLNANVLVGEANTVCPSPSVGPIIAYCMGWCIGKCLFHSISLDAQLSKMFLALLLDVPPRISDIAEFDPGLAKLIQQAEVDEDAFCTLRESIPGLGGRWFRSRRYKLAPAVLRCSGSALKPRLELYPAVPPASAPRAGTLRVIDTEKVVLARHYPGAADTIRSARRGFCSAIPPPAAYFLDVDLLHATVVGRPVIDVLDWRANSRVVGFPPDCLVPEWFWDILEGHPRVRAEILHFSCGIRAPPQEGFAALGRPLFRSDVAYPFTLRPCAARKLPTAHTCTNTLELPLVETRRDLLVALRKSLFYGRTMDVV